MIKNKRILITGVGSIGSELAKQLAQENILFLVDIEETRCFGLVEELRLEKFNVTGRVGDIRDKEFLEFVFNNFHPEIVFNAAARKHVSPCEDNPMEAVSVNIIGTNNLIVFCKKYKVDRFVSTSTDKVVDAEYIMGATKKVAEILVRNAGYVSVRFGNVLNSNGSLLQLWDQRIKSGKSLIVTDERMQRFMMTEKEAVRLMIMACIDFKNGGVYILKMGKPIYIIDLARKIIEELRQKGITVPLEIIGMRPGENITEKLMTEEEQKRAVEKDHYWLLYEEQSSITIGKKVGKNKEENLSELP